MAHIVVAGALSHSPLINYEPDPADAAAIERYRTHTRRLGEAIRAARADVLVIIGQDHFRSLFYDLMPPFVIGTGRVDGWGDWRTAKGPFNVATALARHIHRTLLAREFDCAASYELRVDHGITQPFQLLNLPDSTTIVPILVNTSAPPLPTPRRSFAFGEALAAAIRTHAEPLRVAIIGSGGLSHSPPAADIESTRPEDAERVRRLIHGRESVAQDEDGRVKGLLAAVRSGKFAGSVRADWDRRILDRLARGDAKALAHELDEPGIERDGGNGGQELRTWLAMCGATGNAPMDVLGYEPIPYLITGMGVVRAQLSAQLSD